MNAPKKTEVRFTAPDIGSTLAAVSVGDEALIEEIVLPRLRARCQNAGISAGDRVRVEDRSGWTVAIRNGAGRSVLLASAFLAFICIKKAPEQSEPENVTSTSEADRTRGRSTKWVGGEEVSPIRGG